MVIPGVVVGSQPPGPDGPGLVGMPCAEGVDVTGRDGRFGTVDPAVPYTWAPIVTGFVMEAAHAGGLPPGMPLGA